MNQVIINIYEQLGRKALFMLGAKNVAYDNANNALSFQIRGSRFYNHLCIAYDIASDLYNMTFTKMVGCEIKEQDTINGVYADMMHTLITEKTKLYTEL